MKTNKLKFLGSGLIWIIILGSWQLMAFLQVLNKSFFASPLEILGSFGQVAFLGLFLQDLASTLSRLIIGILFGYLLAYLLIFIGFLVPVWLEFLKQLNQVIKYIPSPVLIPLSILFFGLNDLTKIMVIGFSCLTLYLNFALGLLEKEEKNYYTLQKSWNYNSVQRFQHFFWPISNYLSYRVWPSIIVWTLGVSIVVEIILGGATGLGIRSLQFQQLYATNYLYAYIILILALAFSLEKALINFFATYPRTILKKVLGLAILGSIIFSFGFVSQGFIQDFQNPTKHKVISYKAVANLPLLVWAEKYKRLDAKIEFVSSGLQATDTLQADKASVGGFSDIPNVIQAIGNKPKLKIIAQVVEKPNQPSIFLVTKKNLTSTDFSALDNSKIAYFPNNPIIKQGLDFVLSTRQVRTPSIGYSSSQDPVSLSQSLVADQVQALVSIEPYISDSETKLNIKRINPSKSLIEGIKFENLPLAGLVVNTQKFDGEELSNFQNDIEKSIEFINVNSDINFKATGELRDILKKYDLNPDSSLSAWQTKKNTDPKDLKLILNLLKLYQVNDFKESEDLNPADFYL